MNKQVLVDIVAPQMPPPAPPPYAWIALGVLCALLVLAGALYGWGRRTHIRRLAKARLRRTVHALRDGRIGPRTAVFDAAAALQPLRDRLCSDAALNLWRALDEARYARQTPSLATSEQIILRAQHLLRARC